MQTHNQTRRMNSTEMKRDIRGSAAPAKSTTQRSQENTEILFSHERTKITSFCIPRTQFSSREAPVRPLPFTAPGERTIATGLLKLYRAKPHNIVFIQSGSTLHPVMAKSQCWCVEERNGRGIFVLKIRQYTYWRVEIIEGQKREGEQAVEVLKRVLNSILAFEGAPCPFERVVHAVPEERKEGEREISERRSKRHERPDSRSSHRRRPRAPSRRLTRLDENPVFESFDDLLKCPAPIFTTCEKYEEILPEVTYCSSPKSISSAPSLASDSSSIYSSSPPLGDGVGGWTDMRVNTSWSSYLPSSMTTSHNVVRQESEVVISISPSADQASPAPAKSSTCLARTRPCERGGFFKGFLFNIASQIAQGTMLGGEYALMDCGGDVEGVWVDGFNGQGDLHWK